MTAQIGERIFYRGIEHFTWSEPLLYLHNKHIRFEAYCTACFRGYMGTWEVVDDKLYLIDLEGSYAWVIDTEKYHEEKRELRRKIRQDLITSKENQQQLKILRERLATRTETSIEGLFPGQNKVFAAWYNNTLKINQGKCLEYHYPGWESIYESNLLLTFEEGVLIKEWIQKNQCPKKALFKDVDSFSF